MGSLQFDCVDCDKTFDIRMKLNRHVAKFHKVDAEINFMKEDLTDAQKEKYFDLLKGKYLEVQTKVEEMKKKYEYLENNLTSVLQKKSVISQVKTSSKKKASYNQIYTGRSDTSGTYEDIEGDPPLPEGWKSALKKCFMPSNKTYIKIKVYWAPNGRYCSSRAQAMQYMFESGQSSPQEIEIMRAGLKYDGWETLDQLPVGWMAMKDVSKNGYKYLSDTCIQLPSGSRSALKYMLANNMDEDIAKFISFQFIKEVSPSDITWVESSAVPFRWKVGLLPKGGRGPIILTPDGHCFTSTKNLVEMLGKSEDYQMEELEPFLKYLGTVKYKSELKEHPDWAKAASLPPGWMKRRNETNQKINFLSPQGRVFSNRALVAAFLNEPMAEKEVAEAAAEEEWKEDSSVPKGWLSKLTSRGTWENVTGKSFRDPEGRVYASRVEAIRQLAAGGAGQEQLAGMRRGLVEDGWQEVDYLPTGWMIRESLNTKKIPVRVYLTPQLQILKTLSDVIRSMKDTGVDEEQRMKALSHKWTQDDDLPKGFLYCLNNAFSRSDQTFRSYMTAEGKYYASLFHLLRSLNSSGANPEALEAARAVLVKQGWVVSEFLPPGWLFKNETKAFYLTPEYLKLSKRDEVVKFMNEKGGMEKDIQIFNLNFKEAHPTAVKYPKSADEQKPKPNSFHWSDDPSLPEGWKSAPYNPKLLSMQNKKLCKYLSPDGSFFNSKPAALRHLLASGCSREDIAKMEVGLGEEGYAASQFLPEGWRVKTGSTWYIFLSPTFETFSNVKKVMDHMVENAFEVNVIKTVEENFGENSNANMERNSFEKINGEGSDEDWDEHNLLPQGWKFRINSEAILIFLTESGVKLNSLKAAKLRVRSKEMKLDSQTEARVLSNLICFAASFRGQAKPNMEKPKDSVETLKVLEMKTVPPKEVRVNPVVDKEDSVPAGWKMAKFSSERDVILTSPQGKLFLSRASALEWMVKQKYSNESVARLTSSLSREGWGEEEGLPQGWRVRREEGRERLLTGEGKLLYGVREALLMLGQGEDKEKLLIWGGGKEAGEEGGWQEASSLPPGWQLGEGGRIRDSRGVVLGGRREAIQLMIREHHSPAHIFRLWAGLGEEGWKEEPSLPTGWRRRAASFLSPLMEEVGSVEALLHLLERSPEHSQEEVARVRMGLQGEANNSN